MLTNRIVIPEDGNDEAEEAPEDIIASALGNLFPDDTRNSHGIPGQSICYHSPRFGNLELRIPAHPDVEEGRKLFAHYLWNAALLAADAIEVASWDGDNVGDGRRGGEEEGEVPSVMGEVLCGTEERRWWNVRGFSFLELGAGMYVVHIEEDNTIVEQDRLNRYRAVDVEYIGTALPSLVAALSSAESVMITDHPSSPSLTSDAVQVNTERNLVSGGEKTFKSSVTIAGYTWGTSTFYSPSTYGVPLPSQPKPHSFDRIMLADCLWMVSQHVNLIKTIMQYLKSESDACALVIAGFHTGRDVVSNFFEIATGEEYSQDERDEEVDPEEAGVKGCLRTSELFEVSITGERRAWQAKREGEAREEAKRWCVCAVLVMR